MSTAGKVRVIFVSKRNSLRSVLAHACLEHVGGERFAALSCGSPKYLASEIHPAALGALASARMRPPLGIPISWERLKERGAARAAFIITLDEETIGAQPAWPGQADTALWSMPDVAALGDPEKTAYGAIQALYALRRRLELFVNLPLVKGDRVSLRADVRDLGTMR
ncbi:protein tyrosine phosphatase [Variovorax sp. Root318D1]|uniref:protein-tyrosine-phosphatase n=1 Tax=Variovorax sp. Root318D1 TaxID=1736513 RepID=UPI0006FDDB25|nr:protein-tyrosine-phosphatase [Variovorax sp. Root318D1]KQU87053.1 protein tyrosine phosphatase [Variovorax sp. Root318D1]